MNEKHRDLKILIVDDDPGICEILGDFVSEVGFTPLIAHGMAKALSILEESALEVVMIISDVNMPGGDGIELRTATLKKYRDIPCALLSGEVTRDQALRGMELKIAAFLTKPPRYEVLSELILKETEHRLNQIRGRQTMEKNFLNESAELLEEFEKLALALESVNTDSNAINTLYRFIQTIKSGSIVLEDPVLYRFAHNFGDFIAYYKNNPITTETVSVFLRGHDILKEMILSVQTKDGRKFIFEELAKEIPEPKSIVSATPDSAVQEVTKKVNDLVVSASTVEGLMNLSRELRNLSIAIQNGISQLFKVPLTSTLQTLPPILLELARPLEKDIKLSIHGEDLCVDALIKNALDESLLHLLRNCIDHGIEPSHERLGKGKSAQGQIWIDCAEENGSVVVKVSDDGRGVEHSDNLERMSIVRAAMERLNGRVEVSTIRDKGSTITLHLPAPKRA